jgi:hypothetical protein
MFGQMSRDRRQTRRSKKPRERSRCLKRRGELSSNRHYCFLSSTISHGRAAKGNALVGPGGLITGRWRGCDDDDGGTRCAGDRWVSSRVCRCRASTSPDRCHGAIGKVKRTRRRLARVTIQRIRAQFQRGLFRAQCGLTRRRPNIVSEKWRPFSAHTMALRSWPRPVARSPYGRSFKVLQVPPNVRRPGLQNCPTRAGMGVATGASTGTV